MHIRCDDIQRVIKQFNSTVCLEFRCKGSISENQLSNLKSSEFENTVINSKALRVNFPFI